MAQCPAPRHLRLHDFISKRKEKPSVIKVRITRTYLVPNGKETCTMSCIIVVHEYIYLVEGVKWNQGNIVITLVKIVKTHIKQ